MPIKRLQMPSGKIVNANREASKYQQRRFEMPTGKIRNANRASKCQQGGF